MKKDVLTLLAGDVAKINCTSGSVKVTVEYEEGDTCMAVSVRDAKDEQIEYLTNLLADALVSDLTRDVP